MTKAKMRTTAIAIAVLLAGVAAQVASAVDTEALGYTANPNVIVGKWRGTGDTSKCPQTELGFTQSTFTSVQDGVAHQSRLLGFAIQKGTTDTVVVTVAGEDAYQFLDANHMKYLGVFAQCPYTRE